MYDAYLFDNNNENTYYDIPVIIKVLDVNYNNGKSKNNKLHVNKLFSLGIITLSLSFSCFIMFGINVLSYKPTTSYEYVFGEDNIYSYKDLNISINNIGKNYIELSAGTDSDVKNYRVKSNGNIISINNTKYKVNATIVNGVVNLNIYEK